MAFMIGTKDHDFLKLKYHLTRTRNTYTCSFSHLYEVDHHLPATEVPTIFESYAKARWALNELVNRKQEIKFRDKSKNCLLSWMTVVDVTALVIYEVTVKEVVETEEMKYECDPVNKVAWDIHKERIAQNK